MKIIFFIIVLVYFFSIESVDAQIIKDLNLLVQREGTSLLDPVYVRLTGSKIVREVDNYKSLENDYLILQLFIPKLDKWVDIPNSFISQKLQYFPLRRIEGLLGQVVTDEDAKEYLFERRICLLDNIKDKEISNYLIQNSYFKIRAKNAYNKNISYSNEVTLIPIKIKRKDKKEIQWIVENMKYPCVLCEHTVAKNPGYYRSRYDLLEVDLTKLVNKFKNTKHHIDAVRALVSLTTRLALINRNDSSRLNFYIDKSEKYIRILEKTDINRSQLRELKRNFIKGKYKAGLISLTELREVDELNQKSELNQK